MAERDLIEKLDQAVAAILAGGDADQPDTLLGDLIGTAATLRDLPDPAFKARLSAELASAARNVIREKEKTMSTAVQAIPAGFHTVTPYLHVQGGDKFIEFLTQAFGAKTDLRIPGPEGTIMHAEIQIGDSKLEFGETTPMPAAVHLYVPDVDAVYQRALDAGATSLHPLTDQPYGDREGSVKDPFGNNWYIATHTASGPSRHTPEGLRTITPYLHPKGAKQLIEFLKEGLGAEEVARHAAPDGSIAHAKIRIGDSIVEMSDAHGQWPPMPMPLHIYVEDTDALYARAIQAGAESISAPEDKPYGDRIAGIKDPAGNLWYIATHVRDVEYNG